jgi:ribosomal protein S18 acetylase RimI-like enzyme
LIDIRLARRDDAPTLASLGEKAFTQAFGHMYRPEDLAPHLRKNHSREVYESLLADDRWGLWLAESDGAAIGYCAAGPCSLPVPDMPANAGELARVYVLKSHQGDGLGRRMLTIALDWMRPRFDHIYLSVYTENFTAQRLYERFGFVKVHDYFYTVGNHADPEWIMELRR